MSDSLLNFIICLIPILLVFSLKLFFRNKPINLTVSTIFSYTIITLFIVGEVLNLFDNLALYNIYQLVTLINGLALLVFIMFFILEIITAFLKSKKNKKTSDK